MLCHCAIFQGPEMISVVETPLRLNQERAKNFSERSLNFKLPIETVSRMVSVSAVQGENIPTVVKLELHF